MSQDVVADALNQILNARKASKQEITVKRHSKLLLGVLAIAKLKGYIKGYKVDKTQLSIELGEVHGCKAIKPRYMVSVDRLEKYVKRYLPAKNIGIIIVSTSQGLMTHHTAIEKNVGGSLIAFLY